MENTVLSVKDLSVTFNVKIKKPDAFFSKNLPLYAVKKVNFNVTKGEILGIVGESGCGKSSLAKEIIKINHGSKVSGSILFNGVDINKIKKNEFDALRKDIQIIFQDPLASLNPRMNVFDIIAEPLKVFNKNLSATEVKKQVFEVMEQVGLNTSYCHKFAHEFSGGQAQRIGIARALILKPKLLICDEAVSALDVSIKAQIINLLLDINKKYNMAIIFISHDLSIVKYISNRILVMYLGEVVEYASSDDIYKNPMHPYTQSLFSAIPTIEAKKQRIIPKGDIPSPLEDYKFCSFALRCSKATDKCKQAKPILQQEATNHWAACFYAK